jgi:elongation factor P
MATTSDFRTGLILIIDNEFYGITEFQHVKVARGGAFARTKLKNLRTGRVIERNFRSGEKVADARVVRRPMQYLYRDGDQIVLMDNETYEQLPVEADLLQSGLEFLKEGGSVDVLMYKDVVVSAEIPLFVNLTVASTEPGLKGDTVSGASKKAQLESGGTIQVPLFVEEGDVVRIDTRTGSYIERVNK